MPTKNVKILTLCVFRCHIQIAQEILKVIILESRLDWQSKATVNISIPNKVCLC